jgi:hypothetical protein
MKIIRIYSNIVVSVRNVCIVMKFQGYNPKVEVYSGI